jgi:PPP family 3-phenylpropionic acid transporter
MCLPYYVFYTFRSVYFNTELKIENEQYGVISGITSVMASLAPIFWTNLGDRTRRHKLVLILASTLSSLFFLGFFPLSASNPYKFPFAVGLTILSNLCLYGTQPLLDARVMKILTSAVGDQAKALYGRQRLWGTLSYAFITFVVGYIYQSAKAFWPIFVVSAITTVIFLVFALHLIPNDDPKQLARDIAAQEASLKTEKSKSSMIDFPTDTSSKKQNPYVQLLTNPTFSFFLLVTFCNGFSRGVGTHYLPSFTIKCITDDKMYVSIQATMGIILEVILFFFTKNIVQRIGIYWMLIIAQASMAVRMGFYGFIPLNDPRTPIPALIVELLKGVSFACMQIPGVQIATKSAPAGLEATALGLFTAVYVGISPAASGFIGGYCQKQGQQVIFQVSAVLAWVALAGFFIKYYFFDKKISFRGVSA